MKRALFNAVLDVTGITTLRWRRRPSGLYCFNFHRVGNDDGSAFHPNLFSCTGARFAEIVAFLGENFEMVGLDRVVEIVEAKKPLDRRYGLITFDDGYIDNYEVAFDVLRGAGCTAAFFLPTNFIDGREVPWWDRIAWRVACLGDGSLRLPGAGRPVRVSRAEPEKSIRDVLRVVKDSPGVSIEETVLAIEKQVDCPDIAESGNRLFVSWDQVREMRRAGMWFGSHTRSHRILSHLDEAEQREELIASKRILEERLGEQIDALAYPVGGYYTYTEHTKLEAKASGYKIAFNFERGVNRNPSDCPFDIQRIAVDENMSAAALRRSIARAPKW